MAAWLLMRYQRAAFVGFLLTVLSALGIPGTWLLVLLIIAMSTAHLPSRQIPFVFAWIALPFLAALVWQHDMLIALPISQWVVIASLSLAYRRGGTIESIGYAVLLLAVASLIAVYAYYGDLTAFWQHLIQVRLEALTATTDWALPAGYSAQLPTVAGMMTWVAAWTYFMLAFGLFVAGLLLLPGVSASEAMRKFSEFRPNYLAWIVLGATAAGGHLAPLLKELLPFVMMPAVFGGLAFLHAACRAKVRRSVAKGVLGCVYLLLCVLPSVIGLLLVLLAVVDGLFNLRRYIVRETSR